MEEHCIDIKGTEKPCYPNIVEKLNKAMNELPSSQQNCQIRKVSEGLRRAKPEAYEPIVVSIGPYHLKNPKLQAMKNHKLWYLRLLLEQREEKVEKYIVEMKKLEDRVRDCYVEPIHDLNSDEFVQMMLLDACFIIEFFRQKAQNHRNTILYVDCVEGQLCRDLMLLENQLPLFLLSLFYDMTKDPTDPDVDLLLKMAMSSAINLVIPEQNLNSCKLDHKKIFKHLLHLAHVVCRPALPEQKASLENKNQMHSTVELQEAPTLPEQKASLENKNQMPSKVKREEAPTLPEQKASLENKNQMHSAVELEEAGVKFMKSDTAHIFDIKFNNGLMEVPCFSVDYKTDNFFRNLIAFEQHSKDIVPKYFTEYVEFMDQLISSEKDVKLLRNEGIIVNYLGDDKEVSNLFNNLCDGVVVPYPTSYADMRKKVDEHYNKPLNRMRAKLRRAHNYFDTPWATASTIVAVVLLALTLLQTIAAFIYK